MVSPYIARVIQWSALSRGARPGRVQDFNRFNSIQSIGFKPRPNGPASSRKWTQVELA